ncbi:MAG: hypothetical protein WCA78_10315 [Rhizomicrobium sp.]
MLIPMKLAGGKSLLVALAATLVFFVLLSMLVYSASQFMLSHSSFRFSRVATGDIHVDVLVVGNSRAVNLISGRSEPPSVFNLAYNGLGRQATLSWIRIFFDKGNTAKTVVIETTAMYGNEAGCDGKPYWALYGNNLAAQRRACAEDAKSASFFPLTMFNSEQYLRALYYFTLHRHGDQNWANEYDIPPTLCGRLPLESIFIFRRRAAHVDESIVRHEIADLNWWLVQHGHKTKLVFVLAPLFANQHSLPAISDLEKIDRAMFGRDYISQARDLGANCSDFADSIHVGHKGRAKTTPALLRALAART